MYRRTALLILLMLIALLAACGQKGPLYLPDEQGATTDTNGNGNQD